MAGPEDSDVRPRLLDLFCGAGGAAKGYQRAGFYVVGVDIKSQPNYCGDEFFQTDAIRVLQSGLLWRGGEIALNLSDFDAVHASPPCQGYTTMNNRHGSDSPLLIAEVREALISTGLPYVIENVSGARAHLDHPIQLCGRSFGLGVGRHRLFECSFPVMCLECACDGNELPVYGKLDGRRVWTRKDGSELRAAKTLGQASGAMGIDWMVWDELRESIPPAMTEHVGSFFIAEVGRRSREAA